MQFKANEVQQRARPIKVHGLPYKKRLQGKKRSKSLLNRDIAAMAKVWEMLKLGTINWIGRVGRQY